MAYRETIPTCGPRASVRRVAFILPDAFSMLAFTAAMDALRTANLVNPFRRYEITTVSLHSGGVISDLGIPLTTDISIHALDPAQDVIMVVGGFRVKLKPDPVLRKKLAKAPARTLLGGLWNGCYFLAEAGLMTGFRCAFHPEGRAVMAEAFPELEVATNAYVIDRQRISCAGASSALRMMLETMRHLGDDSIEAVEAILCCDEPDAVPGESTPSRDRDPTLPQALTRALELMWLNVEEPLCIDELAVRTGISRRQLERRFIRFTGASPTRYYLELRLTRARQLVLQSNRSLTEVAIATGFKSYPHFHRRFRECFGAAPMDYRTTFESKRNASALG
jgi:AraC family transcriptional regulator, glycine betaine-responsive activator